MASFGSGFASGLGQGMSMGKMLMDTYNSAKERDDLEKAGQLDQEVVDGKFSANDQATADFVNNRDNGYEVEQTGRGLRYRTAGSDNSWNELNTSGKQYRLGDKVQDTEFAPEQIARARSDAIAQAYTKNGDPMRGLQFRQASREERQAGNEEKILDFMRNSSNMDDDAFYSGLSKMATGHGNDGLSFGYTKGPNGENLIGMVGQDGKLVLQPATRDLAISKLLQYVSPKNYQQERVYGLEREKLDETSKYHQGIIGVHQEANRIADKRVGLMGSGGSGGNSFKAMEQKADALTQAYMKADPGMSQEAANKRAWQVLTKDTTGLRGEAEPQVEFDDGNGTKLKGTHSQLMNNPVYRARNAGAEMKDPKAGEQAGKPQASNQPATRKLDMTERNLAATKGPEAVVASLEQKIAKAQSSMESSTDPNEKHDWGRAVNYYTEQLNTFKNAKR